MLPIKIPEKMYVIGSQMNGGEGGREGRREGGRERGREGGREGERLWG